MFGFLGLGLGLVAMFGTGWFAHDVAQNGASVPGVEIPAVLGK